MDTSRQWIVRRIGNALVAFLYAVALSAHSASTPLRAYATEWNSEAQKMSAAQKESLIQALLTRWEPAALRYGADPKIWRDTFALQLSMLPGTRLAALAAAQPENGFQGVIEQVAAVLRDAAEQKAPRKLLGDTTTDLVFVAINPCRIVDTRFGGGGILSTGSPRDFQYANPSSGTFASQGGSATNCALAFANSLTPLVPKAIAATVTVVSPTGSGNLVIYPTGSTPGTTSALNYTTGAVLANSTVIVGAQGGAADFTVALNGPSHSANVVVDAIGYYYAPAATPLDCVTVQSTNGNKTQAPGATDQFGITCTTGYQVTGGGCHFSNTDGTAATENTVVINKCTRTFDTVTQTYTNQWFGQWTNNDPVKSFRFNVRAMCCRTPGH
jgi:hypothetical protein